MLAGARPPYVPCAQRAALKHSGAREMTGPCLGRTARMAHASTRQSDAGSVNARIVATACFSVALKGHDASPAWPPNPGGNVVRDRLSGLDGQRVVESFGYELDFVEQDLALQLVQADGLYAAEHWQCVKFVGGRDPGQSTEQSFRQPQSIGFTGIRFKDAHDWIVRERRRIQAVCESVRGHARHLGRKAAQRAQFGTRGVPLLPAPSGGGLTVRIANAA